MVDFIAIILIFASFIVASIGALDLYTEDSTDSKHTTNFYIIAILIVLLAVVIKYVL
jgi:lysylphosphatidylglycerol synthetase-like protein (DUF2156 family)